MLQAISTSEKELPMSDLDFTKVEQGVDDELTDVRYETSLLNQRESTHGDYEDTARIAGKLKALIHQETVNRQRRGQQNLTFKQLESLDLISTKIGRIIAGDANNPEHWEDIAGYARLIVEG
jgi:hypothetical protein